LTFVIRPFFERLATSANRKAVTLATERLYIMLKHQLPRNDIRQNLEKIAQEPDPIKRREVAARCYWDLCLDVKNIPILQGGTDT